jgi:CubicO group peptidase (beta-lactamase class C family)
VTGVPFDEFLHRAVFKPCGMERTGYYELDRLPDGCADSHIADSKRGGYRTNIYSVDAKGTGAGGAFTTVGDIGRFWEGLYGGTLVGRDLLLKLIMPGAGALYGMGFWLERRADGTTVPRMEGCDPGVSFVSGREADGTAITAVSNFGYDVWSVRRGIINIITH